MNIVHNKMPKIIIDAQMMILDTLRDHIAREGWAALNIRCLAKRCHIAPGTVYNYFPSREAILAAVISRDWKNAEEKIANRFYATEGVGGDPAFQALERLRFLYETLSGFMAVYRKVWVESPEHLGKEAWERGEQGKQAFRRRMENFVKRALADTEINKSIDRDFLIAFLARSIIHWSGEAEVDFSRIRPVIAVLLTEKKE
ncbi:MAG: TetR/AcrR family transcriptional regulator [Spirochaetales bacterium]|nr:TetR/AcrR family transcriptional regulator [Spirochaetales bacterium]